MSQGHGSGESGSLQEWSSDSDGEEEPARVFHRRISTNKDIKTSACTKEGYLLKQTSSFQRWKRRYFKLRGRKLYYAKDTKSIVFDEIDLTDLSVAERSTKNINHSFQVITPFRNLILCADSRREMEAWISALKMAAKNEFYQQGHTSHSELMSGQHNWYACNHARPSYCNVCREALPGVTSHGLSCEVCKFKAHKRCAARAPTNCKWTSLSSIGTNIMEDEDGQISMSHQWMEGNLPVSAKCSVCDRTCGSVMRLQDWRCLWCRAMVHTLCKDQYPRRCPLGQCRVSILPPTAINNIDNDGYWEGSRPPGTSPLLVYVNTKSGDNQGVKFLRRFKQLLNPAQVFDLMNGGPYPGLRLFQKFDSFRILICGGDGSVGWVLAEIDKLELHKQCQIGVLPFGTGNDLARVLGWGAAFDDDTQLPTVLERLERAQIKMLDRWSIWTYEGTMPPPRKLSQQTDPISQYEDSVANYLSKILHSEDHQVVISSAKVLCSTVRDFVTKVGDAHEDEEEDDENSISKKCAVLNEKLENLLTALNLEEQALTLVEQEQEKEQEQEHAQEPEELTVGSPERDTVPGEITVPRRMKSAVFKPRAALMSRANSLKKAVRQIIEHTERAVDEQNLQSERQRESLQELLSSARLEELSAGGASRSAPSFSVLTANNPPPLNIPEGSCSPQGASRRISSMSTFNRSASVGSSLCLRDSGPHQEPGLPHVAFTLPYIPPHSGLAMAHSKYSIGRIIADIVSFLIVVIGALVVFLAPFQPVQRGFFCDDQTIQYPYREDTVSTTLAGVLGVIVPCIPIFILEALRLWFAQKDECSTKSNCTAFMKKYCRKLCVHVGVFLFGAAICMLITEFLKLTVGRLRPHFIDLCRPDPTSYNCSDGYIINFRCSSGADEKRLEDARKSFPSGHSSFTVFSVTYLVMYLQIRLPRRESRLLRPMLQTVFIVGSFYVLVSRISDHKHHWTDVLAGSILGLVCAVFTVLFISDLWTPANKELAVESSILPMTMMPPSSPTAGQYNVSRVHSDQSGSSKGD